MTQASPHADALADRAGGRAWLSATLAICVVTTLLSLWIGRDRDRIRSSDEAGYAEQARSLLDDGSLTIGFVRHFHVKYPADIDHPEDFYPPGTGALIAAAWAVLGESDFASSVPSILLTGLLLPLLAFALARRLGASPPFAFGCAMTILFEPLLRFHAFQGLSDVPFTACITGAMVLALREGRVTTALAGVALGLAFWFKPTAVLFAPGLALAALIHGSADRRDAIWRVGTMALATVAVCAPWLIRNQTLFGDPIYSGNKHLSAAANDPEFTYFDLRKVYWDEGAPGLAESVHAGMDSWLLRWATHVYQIVVDHGWAAFGLPFAVGAVLLWRRRSVGAVLVVIVTFAIALSAVFAVFLRYLLPLFPMVAAVSWAAGDHIVARLRGTDVGRALADPARAALLLAAIASLQGGMQVVRDLVLGRVGYGESADEALWRSAEWAAENLPPEARVMSQEALRFRHVSGLRAVNTPWDAPDAIEQVVRHYGVTHLVVTPGGDFGAISNRFVFPYLESHGERWSRTDHDGFTVWERRLQ